MIECFICKVSCMFPIPHTRAFLCVWNEVAVVKGGDLK